MRHAQSVRCGDDRTWRQVEHHRHFAHAAGLGVIVKEAHANGRLTPANTRPADDGLVVDAEAFQQHHEFVAAQARHGIDLAHAAVQAPGDLDQQLVAGIVALGVVE